MNNATTIYFIGGVGRPDEFGGEASKNKEILAVLRQEKLNVTVIDTLNSSRNPLRLLRLLFSICFAIFFHPHATFIFSTSFANIYPFIKLFHFLRLRRNIIYWVIGGIFSQWVLDGKFKAKYLHVIRRFIVEGDKMKRQLARAGFHDCTVVPNFKTIPRLPVVEKYNDGKTHFYFISRITPTKGVPAILHCARQLNQSPLRDRFHIDLYGPVDPSYRDEFLSSVEKTHGISYKGQLNLIDPDNYKIIAPYHYMLFPTTWIGEGFPGVIIDAMIAATPVIASDWNFNSEFIHSGINGYTFPHNDPDALLTIINRVITTPPDYPMMAAKCREIAANYDSRTLLTAMIRNGLLSF